MSVLLKLCEYKEQDFHHVRLSQMCWGFWVTCPRPGAGLGALLDHLVMLCRRVWLRQSRLLALLCCSLLGADAPDQDVLLELAAARVLTLLLDPSSWACCASGTAQIRSSYCSLIMRWQMQLAHTAILHASSKRNMGGDRQGIAQAEQRRKMPPVSCEPILAASQRWRAL